MFIQLMGLITLAYCCFMCLKHFVSFLNAWWRRGRRIKMNCKVVFSFLVSLMNIVSGLQCWENNDTSDLLSKAQGASLLPQSGSTSLEGGHGSRGRAGCWSLGMPHESLHLSSCDLPGAILPSIHISHTAVNQGTSKYSGTAWRLSLHIYKTKRIVLGVFRLDFLGQS